MNNKDKGKMILICGSVGAGRIHHIINSLQSEKVILCVAEVKKEQLPLKPEIDFLITNPIINDVVESNHILQSKPLPDWNRKNYRQRNKKHKSKRK